MSDCICHSGKKVPACPEHGDAKARKEAKNPLFKKETRPRRRIRTQSDKQRRREDVLNGIKVERLLAQQRQSGMASSEPFSCEGECDKRFQTFDGAWTGLHLHHVKRRSQGAGYRGGVDFGVDHPDNLQLLCFDCHRSEHRGPEFSTTENASA